MIQQFYSWVFFKEQNTNFKNIHVPSFHSRIIYNSQRGSNINVYPQLNR